MTVRKLRIDLSAGQGQCSEPEREQELKRARDSARTSASLRIAKLTLAVSILTGVAACGDAQDARESRGATSEVTEDADVQPAEPTGAAPSVDGGTGQRSDAGLDPAPAPMLPKVVHDKGAMMTLPSGMKPARIVFKVHEGIGATLKGGGFVLSALGELPEALRGMLPATAAIKLEQLNRALTGFGLKSAPMFKEAPELLALLKEIGEEKGGRKLDDLRLFFEVPWTSEAGPELDQLLAALNALDIIEIAYAEPPTELAQAHVPTPDYQPTQGYLGPAPAGINATLAASILGARGKNVRIIDLEHAWNTSHEDLPAPFATDGTFSTDQANIDHGTAVLGEMVGKADGVGVTGIVPESTYAVSSWTNVSVASAIAAAVSRLAAGDVILLEGHRQAPVGTPTCTCNTPQCNLIPIEYWAADYAAITTAVSNGIVVVEAGGNGSVDLDDPAYGDAFNRSIKDSGAILVAASDGGLDTPACFTNYGSRIDMRGWGTNVVTTGYGGLFNQGANRKYRSDFGGTSAASPMVAAAAAALQSTRIERSAAPLTPWQVRTLLAETGTPQGEDAKNIGPLPDLEQALLRIQGWRTTEHERMLVDVNADNYDDIVGFGRDGVYVALSKSTGGFDAPHRWSDQYGSEAGGWSPAKHLRMLADVDGDGDKDIVGFGGASVQVGLNNTKRTDGTSSPSFERAQVWLSDFSYATSAGSWRVDTHLRFLADVNKDGRQDIVGIKDTGVFVSLSNGTSFAAKTSWSTDFGTASSPRAWNTNHPRMLADVDGDGVSDVVGFWDDGVYVGLAKKNASGVYSSFGTSTKWVSAYGRTAGGWTVTNHVRTLADVDADRKADIIGFANDGVHISKSSGTAFAPYNATPAVANFGYNQGWRTTNHIRIVRDINKDNRADIVGFGGGGVYVSKWSAPTAATPSQLSAPSLWVGNYGASNAGGGWKLDMHPRLLGHVNGGTFMDIVGFGTNSTFLSFGNVSSFGAPTTAVRAFAYEPSL